jgi:hypothetical protein
MKFKKYYLRRRMHILKNILLVTCIITGLVISVSTYASTVITTTLETRKVEEKYSLKNLGSMARKTASFYTLKSSLEFKGLSTISNSSNAAYLKYNKGNISYVIPYRYKVILPKFKAPTRIQP